MPIIGRSEPYVSYLYRKLGNENIKRLSHLFILVRWLFVLATALFAGAASGTNHRR